MREIFISPTARADLFEILDWTSEVFGEVATSRYDRLIRTALNDLAEDSFRHGSLERSDLAVGCRTYHLFHSRKRVTHGLRVKDPRHLIVYRLNNDGLLLEVIRVLHDSMELRRHVMGEK